MDGPPGDRRADASLIPLTMLYGGLLAILMGSLASAEERHLGTLEWQTLLPSPAWQQWAVKVGVMFGLALLLGVALPALLGHAIAGAREYPGRGCGGQVVPIMLLLTASSLYLSSLCKSGVGALVLSFPTIVATFLLARTIRIAVVARSGRSSARQPFNSDPVQRVQPAARDGWGASSALLALARVPQSPDGGSQRRLGQRKQVLSIAGYVASVCALFLIALGRCARPRRALSAAPRRRRSRVPPPAHPAGSVRCATPRSARSAPASRPQSPARLPRRPRARGRRSSRRS